MNIVLSASSIMVEINVLASSVSVDSAALLVGFGLVVVCPTVPEHTRGRWEPIARELSPARRSVQLKTGDQRSGGEKLTGTGASVHNKASRRTE